MQHILEAHGPYFANQGSLAVWSTQGMERSHWQARCAFQKATDHGGGINDSNAMRQLFQWWYRRLEIRYKEKKKKSKTSQAEFVSRAIYEVRKARYENSTARQRHAEWLATQERDGKKWRPR